MSVLHISGFTAGTVLIFHPCTLSYHWLLHGLCLRTVSESDWDLKTCQMITFLFCLFIFLSGFSFLSVSLPLTLFNLSLYSFHFSQFIVFSPPLTVSAPFCLFSFWPRTDIEGVTSDGQQSSLLSSVWCRRAEPRAFLSQLLTPKNTRGWSIADQLLAAG